jgi:5-(hydroxymethyl)furfural/furfural oxidase
VFLPNARIVARLARRRLRNWVEGWAAALAFDSAFMRRSVLWRDALDVAALALDRSALEQLVRRAAAAAYHVCGTCKMGSAEDAQAVVDAAGHVWGLQGLRVGDASVFPTIPCANTHLTVLMAAEKMADHVKADWRAD